MFTVLLILASQRIESIINLGGSDDEVTKTKMTREVRGAPPTSIEWMILAYVAGTCVFLLPISMCLLSYLALNSCVKISQIKYMRIKN